MDPRPFSPESESPSEPWAQDPDAWRATPCGAPEAGSCPPTGAWPQLDASPVYWMWLERLERDGGPTH